MFRTRTSHEHTSLMLRVGAVYGTESEAHNFLSGEMTDVCPSDGPLLLQ